MPSSTDSWGIEVGSNAIKAIRLQRQGNDISMTEFDVIPFKKVLTTPELDVEEAIRLGLDQFLSRHNIGKASVVVSVPGHMAFSRFAKLPPVEPKKIPDIVKFEAVQQIPFPIEQVEWDYQTFQNPNSPDVEVGIFAITKQRVAPWLDNFQQVGIPVHAITVSPIASFNALNYDRDLADRSGGTILMDVGTQATDLMITEDGRLWSRTIPIGGNHFTEALVRSFKLSFSKAEKLKREASTSKYARQIFQAMRPVFVDLVQEVQKSLGYYQSMNRDCELERLIGLGSTWRLPGLQTFLKQQLQIEVSRLDQFKKVEATGRSAATFGENTVSLAPAYGLALQGLEQETVAANLLPTPVVRQQVWRAKQAWFAAAAAVVLLAGGVAYLSPVLSQQAFNSSDNQRVRRNVQQVLDEAQSLERRWSQISQQDDPRQRIGNIQNMLNYREVWPNVLDDLDKAMMALEPQEALILGDLEAIGDIPRNQRRQMFIDMIETQYQSPAATGQEGAGMYGMEYGMYGPGMGMGMEQPSGDDDEDAEQIKPHFTVRLVGWTPYHNPPEQTAASFIDRTFKQWLVNHGQQPGRHYRITGVTLARVSPRQTAQMEDGRSGRSSRSSRSRSSRGMPPGMEYGMPPGMGMEYGMPPGMEGEFGMPGSYGRRGETGEMTLLPPRPFVDEDKSNDQQFEIEFQVELIPPEQLHQDESADDSQPGVANAEVSR